MLTQEQSDAIYLAQTDLEIRAIQEGRIVNMITGIAGVLTIIFILTRLLKK